ncbi:MAG: transcription antitermination factor NusB [Planctomycetota bacterium]|nr:MAG: transcription antitermination factor NusB [Planctomycetota bacterium]
MALPREIRRLAFQVLYELDARNGGDAEEVRGSIDEEEKLRPAERERVFGLASEAWAHRAEADAAMLKLAPDWPAHRQPVVDRSILRLAYYEMTRGGAAPKMVINEAVELAKTFSTERSPAFVNALLDKVMKSIVAAGGGGVGAGADAAAGSGTAPPREAEE